MSTFTVLTDFSDRVSQLEQFVAGKRFTRRHITEPSLFAARVGAVDDAEIREILRAGLHIERAGTEKPQMFVVVGDNEAKLLAVLGAMDLRAKIERDGGNELVEFTGPALSPDEEVTAVRREGFRVGRCSFTQGLRMAS